MTSHDIAESAIGDAGNSKPCSGRYVVPVPPCERNSAPVAVIACELHPAREWGQFRRRAGDLSRALGAMLNACPEQVSREHV